MSKHTILLACGDQASLKNVAHELEKNFQVFVASSYGHALRELQDRGDIEVVIADDGLGAGPRGLDLLREVKKRHETCLRVLVTEEVHRAELSRAMQDHVIHNVMRKPWARGALADALKKRLS